MTVPSAEYDDDAARRQRAEENAREAAVPLPAEPEIRSPAARRQPLDESRGGPVELALRAEIAEHRQLEKALREKTRVVEDSIASIQKGVIVYE